MREVATSEVIREFMRRLGRRAPRPLSVFFTGGASAVITGWRDATIDIDLRLDGDDDDVLREMVRLKAELNVNVELASPSDFIPAPPGWRERSRFIGQDGNLAFFHYDFYGQALSKIERGHDTDKIDVDQMLKRGLIEPNLLLDLYGRIEPELFRYPAIDAREFRAEVERVVAQYLAG